MDIMKWKRGSGLRRFSEAQRQKIRADYERGLTLAALARAFKATRQTVTQAIIDAGGTVRTKGTRGVPS
jgi:transposase-like protein